MDYKFEFDDLSYSGIVGIIDSDEKVAKEYLVENFFKMQDQKKSVEKLRKQLSIEETYLERLEKSIEMVFSHMKFKKPMALIIGEDVKEIIIISESNTTLEKNVL
ncbi:hypothetical protein B0A56_00785 [Flavobacterium columnare NBRC 100251 = ATCC 23463]|nr:hypothetical protein B0A56_00785 [Flavobacterium columnare NBRC 100251 = ATCC 23463]